MGWEKKGQRPAIVGTRVRTGPTGREQVVRSAGWQWCDEAEEIFLDTLAASCNVSLAADAAGFSTPTVYRQLRLRPDFEEKWRGALAQGYARLEASLIEAANDALSDADYDASRPIPRMTIDQAMNLLRAHRNEVLGSDGRGAGRGTPGRNARRRDLAEVRDSILGKIAAIERQAEAAATVTTAGRDGG
ncbi:MAG: hypothetical protein LH466_08050 [Sphingomonas bacterium]|nr:hypothetical protein [Sphingomonas bacterium]